MNVESFEIFSNIGTAVVTGGTVAGLLFAFLKKWFIDTETYYRHRQQDKEEVLKKEEESESADTRIIARFEELIQKLEKEKADADDLAKAERKIEKLDEKVNAVTQATERVCIKLDMYIEGQKEMQKDIKDMKESMKEIYITVESVKTRLDGSNNG